MPVIQRKQQKPQSCCDVQIIIDHYNIIYLALMSLLKISSLNIINIKIHFNISVVAKVLRNLIIFLWNTFHFSSCNFENT